MEDDEQVLSRQDVADLNEALGPDITVTGINESGQVEAIDIRTQEVLIDPQPSPEPEPEPVKIIDYKEENVELREAMSQYSIFSALPRGDVEAEHIVVYIPHSLWRDLGGPEKVRVRVEPI